MPYATSQGARIHYTSHGSGPPLLLHHGFSSSARAWSDFGYADALAQTRTLILPDARGHGRSDKPHDPAAYSIALRVADMLAVLDDLGVDRADYLGYSMGGWVGFGLLALAPGRIGRAAIGGAHPYADDSWSRPAFDPRDPTAFIRDFEATIGDTLPEETHPLILENDLAALSAGAGPRPSLEHALPTITSPVLLYAGDREARLDPIRRAADAMPAAQLVILPGCGHVDAYLRADLVLGPVAEFLDGDAISPKKGTSRGLSTPA